MRYLKYMVINRLTLSLLLTAVLIGCGKKSGTGDVTISSDTFATSGNAIVSAHALVSPTAFAVLDLSRSYSVAPSTTVTDFKICVKRIKLEGDDDQPRKKEGEKGDNGESDPDDIKFAPGLIDVGSGGEKTWGTVNLPTGFKLKKIKIKVKKDKDLCGVDYSVKFNSATTDQDVEFKWKFEPPIDLDAGVISLRLNEVIAALRQAGDDGTLASLKTHCESIESSGRKK